MSESRLVTSEVETCKHGGVTSVTGVVNCFVDLQDFFSIPLVPSSREVTSVHLLHKVCLLMQIKAKKARISHKLIDFGKKSYLLELCL